MDIIGNLYELPELKNNKKFYFVKQNKILFSYIRIRIYFYVEYTIRY